MPFDLTVAGYWVLIVGFAGFLAWLAIRNEPPRSA